MSNLIHSKDIAAQRLRVVAYYRHVHALRDNDPGLDTSFGAPFLYRADGTALDEQTKKYGFWNMRRAPPIVTIHTPGGLMQIYGRMGDPPCEFPDLGDMVVVDATVDAVLDPLVEAVPENWESPLNKKLFKTPKDMLAKAVDNVCIGDIPWQSRQADEALRKQHLWDIHDLEGNPWVVVGQQALFVKTQRLQANARAIMGTQKVMSAELYEGNPMGPSSKQIGVFRYATT